jgi:hypothetical protein
MPPSPCSEVDADASQSGPRSRGRSPGFSSGSWLRLGQAGLIGVRHERVVAPAVVEEPVKIYAVSAAG